MVTLGLRQDIEETDLMLEDEVNRQVAEIMEAAEFEEEQRTEPDTRARTWNFSMPFAGVRYYSYD